MAASVRMGADDSRDTDDVSARQAAEALALERRDAPLPRAFGGPPRVADPPPAPAAVDAPDPQPRAVPIERARPRRRVWTWSFGGATLGSAAAALGAGLTARDRESQHDACTAQGHECGELERQGGRYARAANALIGVAGGFACATVAAFLIEGKRQRSVALRVAPGSLGVSGAF